MKRVGYYILIILLFSITNVNAEVFCDVSISGNNYSELTDSDYKTFKSFSNIDVIDVECDKEIKYVYIYYHDSSSHGHINDTVLGERGYLHELVDLNNGTSSFSITYEEGYSIADISFYDDSRLPSYVENWETLKEADLMIFPTRVADEELFFSALIPTYINQDRRVQIVYFINDYSIEEYHELLEGLWAIGIKYYPVFSSFPDSNSPSLKTALKNFNEKVFSEDDAISFMVNQIRKYRPFVVVGHDENGEYKDGQNMLNTYFLKKSYYIS